MTTKHTHAQQSNDIFEKVSEEFERGSGDIHNNDLQKNIEYHFHWEQISYVMPFDKMNVISTGKEWRLMYSTHESMEYHNHLKVKKSTLKTAGYGLFADRTFFHNDIISVYLGDNMRSTINHSPYAMDFSVLGTIDAKAGIMDDAHLFLGCHFVNDKHYGSVSIDKRKKYNAKFDDLFLVATRNIRRHTEILVDYNTQYKK